MSFKKEITVLGKRVEIYVSSHLIKITNQGTYGNYIEQLVMNNTLGSNVLAKTISDIRNSEQTLIESLTTSN